MCHSNQVCILSCVRDNALKNYRGHDIDLSGSRDVIDDVIRSAIGHFLLVGNWYQASIKPFSRYLHELHPNLNRSRLHLSESNDVIGHVIIGYRTCHFLLVPRCNQVSISKQFRDICI